MIAENFGARLFDATRERMGDAWDTLSANAKLEVQKTITDKAKLILLQVTGEDVKRELAHDDAQFANWKFVGADVARIAAVEAIKDAAKIAREFLGALVLGVL